MKVARLARSTAALALAASAAWSQPFAAWMHNRTITLNTSATGANVTGDVYDFPVLIRLGSAESTIFTQAKGNGADIRFAKSNDSALAYQIETWDSAANRAAIWVKVDTVRGNNFTQSIKIYWGNSAASSLSNGAGVFDTAIGYKTVLHMNEAAGDVLDATANGVIGTNTGTTATAGIVGHARNFGGTNAHNTSSENGRQMIALGTPEALNFGGPLSLSAWVRWLYVTPKEGTSSYRTVLWRGNNDDGEVFVRMETTGESNAYYAGRRTGSSSLTTVAPVTDSSTADSATWIHLAGVYTGTNWQLYRNGVMASQSADDSEGPQVPPTAWHIGRSGIGSNLNSLWWSGDIDEVRISRVARNAHYMKLSYESQRPAQKLTTIGMTGTVPSPPTNVRVVISIIIPGTLLSHHVYWSAPVEDGGWPITGYKAYLTSDTTKACTTTDFQACGIGLPNVQGEGTAVYAYNAIGRSLPGLTGQQPPSIVRRSSNRVIAVTGGDRPYSFSIPAKLLTGKDRVVLSIVDAHGRAVWSTSLTPQQAQSEVFWNGRTARGDLASAGIYFAQIRLEGNESTVEAVRGGVKR